MDDHLTIASAARLIGARELSPVELTRTCLERIDRLDGRIHAFITLDREGALATATRAEREIAARGPIGPLHGIPVGLKDVFKTRNLPTTAHSRLLQHDVPSEDSEVAKRLEAAGAVLMGKLATHEFAFGGPSFDLPWPPARNPWDFERFTGGSSSGPAAAVAAGMILAAVGSDTAGSIRSPAALCGVAGLKPSAGLVSRTGMLPLAESLDHAGPMAWTAADCALLLDVLAAPERSGATGYHAGIERDVKGVRVGVLRHFYEIDRRASEPQIAAMDAALDVLAQLGAEVRAIETAPLADWHAAGFLILLAEAYALYGPALRAQPERFGAIMRDRLAMGAFISAKDRDAATHRREELAAGLRAMTQDVDILATVSQPGEAPLLDRVSKWDGFGTPGYNIPFNMTGDPALSICCGFGPSGLPLGIQLAAKRGADALLLRVAHAYERTTEWRARRPALLG